MGRSVCGISKSSASGVVAACRVVRSMRFLLPGIMEGFESTSTTRSARDAAIAWKSVRQMRSVSTERLLIQAMF
jgi:hypothetical protein